MGQDTGKRTRNVVHAQNLAKSALRPTYSHKKLIDAIGVCLLTFVEYNITDEFICVYLKLLVRDTSVA